MSIGPRPLPEHGGTVVRLAAERGLRPEDILDFSNNADSLVDDLTRRLVKETPNPHGYYPDNDCTALRQALAAHEEVPAEHILVGAGSAELIYLALAALKPRRARIVAPIFSEYALACARLGIPYELHVLTPESGFALTAADVAVLAAWPKSSADMLILCTPNNPTAVVHDAVDMLLRALPTGRVFLDAAYREFLHPGPDYERQRHAAFRALARPEVSVLTLNSFTKYFFCPGVRLGYCLSEPATIAAMAALRAPWTVSRFAELLGLAFLTHVGDYRHARAELPALRERHLQGLTASGLFAALLPTRLNFCAALLREPSHILPLRDFLLARRILIRVCDNIPGMHSGYIRTQVREPEAQDQLFEGLTAFAASRRLDPLCDIPE